MGKYHGAQAGTASFFCRYSPVLHKPYNHHMNITHPSEAFLKERILVNKLVRLMATDRLANGL